MIPLAGHMNCSRENYASYAASEECRTDPRGPDIGRARVHAVEPNCPCVGGIGSDAVVVPPAIASTWIQSLIVRSACFEHRARLKRAEGIGGTAAVVQDGRELGGS